MADQSKPLTYSANDWFYLKPDCGGKNPPAECNKNRTAVNDLRLSTDNMGSAFAKYNDAKVLYNRELLFTVNILFGLALICYYIYVNKSSLPNISNAVTQISAASSKLKSTVSTSVANNLSMRPPK